MAAVIAGRQLGSLGGTKRLLRRAAGRFRSYGEDKQETQQRTASQDRLRPDKQFLARLTKLETVILIKRRSS